MNKAISLGTCFPKQMESVKLLHFREEKCPEIRSKLLTTVTDSLHLEIVTEGFNADFTADVEERFNSSNFQESSFQEKEIPHKFQMERIDLEKMEEFVALRRKCIPTKRTKERKGNAEGETRGSVQRDLNFEIFKESLMR